MDRDDSFRQQADIEQMEHEALSALDAVAAAGLGEEAEILASAAGLRSRWKKQTHNMEKTHGKDW